MDDTPPHLVDQSPLAAGSGTTGVLPRLDYRAGAVLLNLATAADRYLDSSCRSLPNRLPDDLQPPSYHRLVAAIDDAWALLGTTHRPGPLAAADEPAAGATAGAAGGPASGAGTSDGAR